MKRTTFTHYLILLFSLSLVFTQVQHLAAADCSSCNPDYFKNGKCCDKAEAGEYGPHHEAIPKDGSEPCPHGGLCQGDDPVPFYTCTSSGPLEAGVAALFCYSPYAHQGVVVNNNSSLNPPPLRQRPQLFIHHCSYLI